jgi:hypothetical protein
MRFDLPGVVRRPENAPHVFVANSFQDREFARKLANALRRDRVSPYTETGEMTSGDSLLRRLSNSLRPVDCVVPVISIASVAHHWVERELVELTKRDINRRRVRAYPAKVDNCTLPPSLRGLFVADFYTLGWSEAYKGIMAAIQGRPGTTNATWFRHRTHLGQHTEDRIQDSGPGYRPNAEPGGNPELRTSNAEVRPPAQTGAKLVYLSYDRENDGYYKDVLVTWSQMPGFAQFWVNDEPPSVAVDSVQAEPVKLALAKRIAAASGLLCVVGARSYENGWTEWEIRKADELGKRIIAVRINRDFAFPELLSDVGATCALSFTFEGIRRAIDEAYGEDALD